MKLFLSYILYTKLKLLGDKNVHIYIYITYTFGAGEREEAGGLGNAFGKYVGL